MRSSALLHAARLRHLAAAGQAGSSNAWEHLARTLATSASHSKGNTGADGSSFRQDRWSMLGSAVLIGTLGLAAGPAAAKSPEDSSSSPDGPIKAQVGSPAGPDDTLKALVPAGKAPGDRPRQPEPHPKVPGDKPIARDYHKPSEDAPEPTGTGSVPKPAPDAPHPPGGVPVETGKPTKGPGERLQEGAAEMASTIDGALSIVAGGDAPEPSEGAEKPEDDAPKPSGSSGKPVEQPAPLSGPFQLPPLPYPLDALEPHMSSETLMLHWGKHHRTYLENLNKQVEGSELAGKSLDEVVKATWNGGKPQPAFNNAAQAWNHEFFWNSLAAGGGGTPSGPLADAIKRDFGSFDAFKQQFVQQGTAQFGSGWVWLVADNDGKLSVLKTSNAVTPLVAGWTCLLTADVWEHAYYVDFRNRRADYLNTFLANLADWGSAEKRYAAAQH